NAFSSAGGSFLGRDSKEYTPVFLGSRAANAASPRGCIRPAAMSRFAWRTFTLLQMQRKRPPRESAHRRGPDAATRARGVCRPRSQEDRRVFLRIASQEAAPRTGKGI